MTYVLIIISMFAYPDEPLGHTEGEYTDMGHCQAAVVQWIIKHEEEAAFANFTCVYKGEAA